MNLTRKNFSHDEFFVSSLAKSKGINNTTQDAKILTNLSVVADKIQEIRDLLGQPIKISSAYRCLELNRLLKSKDTSQHVIGQAVDFTCPKFGSPEKIVKFLKEKGVVVDQALCEGSWLHLSIKKEGNRNEFAYFLPDSSGKRVKVALK